MSDPETLYIKPTDDTPEVSLSVHSPRSFMAGRSLPENAHEFYNPVIKWVTEHFRNITQPIDLELRFDYFNSSSGRFLFEILSIIERNPKKGLVSIIWVVEHGDDLMLDKGNELKSLLDLSFEIREV